METDLCRVALISDGKIRTVTVRKGENLLRALNRQGAGIGAPCGGKALCGKCRAVVRGAGASAFTEEEKRHVTPEERAGGIRLACCVTVLGDLEVFLPELPKNARILTEGVPFDIGLSPLAKKTRVSLPKPSLEDRRDDFQRLSDALGGDFAASLETLKELPAVLRENGFEVTAVHTKDTLISVRGGEEDEKQYGVAVDIGTTTVVCYLADLRTGKRADAVSALNAQRAFGADVVSRISHSMENEDGLGDLHGGVVKQIGALISELAARNGIGLRDILCAVFAGNTVMMHFLLGLPARAIAAAPFTPALTESFRFRAPEAGLALDGGCAALALPSVAGYVGADIVAGILATGLYRSGELCLFLDIGTNGEIALGNRDRIVCCAAAAGPAFEGAQIKHGMGGVDGAINTVRFADGGVRFTVIGGGRPSGICGSGIVDAVAAMLASGVVDESGRLVPKDGLPAGAKALSDRLVDFEGERAFVLAYGKESAREGPVVITQRDVREIQIAKAAVAAGIRSLIKSLRIAEGDIGRVFLAGGFGNYMDRESAVKIGLLPEALGGRVRAVGNSAGTGALMALLSEDARRACDEIAKKAEYIELSSLPGFADELIECMGFS